MAKLLVLTDEDILEEIAVFQERIRAARTNLKELPATAGTWQARKKLKEKRRILNDEIRHVRKLINIAKETLY